jgi:hypothetical protein
MEYNEEYDLTINKLASIRDNFFNEEDMEAEGHGMEDAVADPYAVVCYIENKLKRQQEQITRLDNALNEIDEIIDSRLYTPLVERLSNAVLKGKGLTD